MKKIEGSVNSPPPTLGVGAIRYCAFHEFFFVNENSFLMFKFNSSDKMGKQFMRGVGTYPSPPPAPLQ